MPYKSRKVNSVEGGQFDSTRKLFHFEIDDNAVYDLTQSYFVFPTEITCAEDGIYNPSLKHPANSLIRHCSARCDRKGDLEDNQYVNVLNNTLDDFRLSDEESRCWFNGTRELGDDKNYFSAFRNLRQDKASTERRADLRVPFRTLFYGLGSFDKYPAFYLGKTTLELELEGSYTLTKENRRYTAGDADDGFLVKGTATATELITDAVFLNRGDLGFWVTQEIKINEDAVAMTITEISVPDGNKKITITVDVAPDPVIVEDADAYIYEPSGGALSHNVLEPYLVLVEHSLPQKAMDKLRKDVRKGFEYQSFVVENDNLTAGNSFFKQYFLDPLCDRTLFVANDQTDLDSTIDNFEHYRTTISGVSTTNKNVVLGNALYRDRIMRGMVVPVNNLHNNIFCIPERVPVSKERTIYQVKLESDGDNMAASNLYLFKRVVRIL